MEYILFTNDNNGDISMTVTVFGNGTVTGISAGGLPDGCVQSADIASGVLPAGTNYAISTGSMDVSSAATTTITGISFTPKYATFIGGVDGSSAAAWGISLTGSVDHHLYDGHQAADGDYAVGGNFANLQTGAGDILQLFCLLTSDGASITKNKVSSPTGTLYYKITFFG